MARYFFAPTKHKNTMKKNLILSNIFVVVAIILFAACSSKEENNTVLWGTCTSYDDFLWCKYVPDTLTHTLGFDFNTDAKNYMNQPLQLALFEKDNNGKMQRVDDDIAELYVNGERAAGNIIKVQTTDTELKVGVVFNRTAADRVHYWSLRPVDDGGLDRINDREPSAYNDDAIMQIRAKKDSRMNPLGEGLMFAGIILVGLLVLWLLMIKPMMFPTFRVSRITLTGPEPYLSMIPVKRCRRLVLTSKKQKQGFFSRIFTGEIKYHINPLWTADVVFEPKDKKSIRIRPDRNAYMINARLLIVHEEYTLENISTKNKTEVVVS